MADGSENLYESLEDTYELAIPSPLDVGGNPLNKEVWYHGRISRETAEQLLKEAPRQVDCFLIRESVANPGTFSISLKHHGEAKHFLIRNQESGIYKVAGAVKGFDGLKPLVEFYRQHPLTSAGELLTTPLVWGSQEDEVASR